MGVSSAITWITRSWSKNHRLSITILVLTLTLVVLGSTTCVAQSCDCPALSSCAPCAGGLTNLTLRFNGASAATVTASDQIGVVFSGVVNPNADFSFAGSLPNEKFVGPDVTVTVNSTANAVFSSLCNNTEVGTTDGSFTVVAAVSKTGGTLCCSTAMMETEPPVINACPADISISLPSNACNIAVTWPLPSATDNCALESLIPSIAPGSNFNPGTTIVEYTARDTYGNTSACSFNVTVTDNTDPIFSACPTDLTIPAGSGCQAAATWTIPTASDNCSVSVAGSHSPGDIFPTGTTTVTYTATDAAGHTATCSFLVVVEDVVAPVISNCPANISLSATGACGATASWVPPSATDACPTLLNTSHNPGDTFPVGTTTVTYTATDDNNNTSTCSFTVIVTDAASPVINDCPGDLTIQATACQTVVTWALPVATDNCSATMTSSHAPGSSFQLGTTLVTYTAVDPQGNSATCSFNVTVVDTSAPVFTTCPANINASAGAGCAATVTWTLPVASDNCNVTISSSHSSGSLFPIGTTTVTYTATDADGNEGSCSFNVVVSDQQPPLFTGCPTLVSVSSDGCEGVATWVPPDTTDNCSVTTVSTHTPGSTFPLGTTAVTYTATDAAGNSTTCSFNVVVNSVAPPAVTNCPEDITLKTIGDDLIVSWSEPEAVAQCGTIETQRSHSPGDFFPIGTTTVTYRFIDQAENVAECEFSVVVQEEELIVDVPQALTPDGDGRNDTWQIGNIEKFVDNSVLVIDRWGNEVFKAAGYDNAVVIWDGMGMNGALVPSGTYFYSIELRTEKSARQQTGFVEVIQ